MPCWQRPGGSRHRRSRPARKWACRESTFHSGTDCGSRRARLERSWLKLDAAIVDALANPTVRKRLTDIGQEIFPRDRQTPEALHAFHKAETEKWWPIIKTAGIKGE